MTNQSEKGALMNGMIILVSYSCLILQRSSYPILASSHTSGKHSLSSARVG